MDIQGVNYEMAWMQIQFMRATQTMYLMDANGIVKAWECRDDFFPGYNSEGEPRASLPNGDYWVSAEITYGCYGPAYGNFYITTGDPRGRDIHGGGSDLDDPFEPYQGWEPTYGCLRMQNQDGIELSEIIIEYGNKMLLEVVDR